MDEQLAIPVKKLKHYIDAAQQGTFVPNRENDELTRALGIKTPWMNNRHARLRCMEGWVSRRRRLQNQKMRRKVEQSELQELKARVRKVEERDAENQ